MDLAPHYPGAELGQFQGGSSSLPDPLTLVLCLQGRALGICQAWGEDLSAHPPVASIRRGGPSDLKAVEVAAGTVWTDATVSPRGQAPPLITQTSGGFAGLQKELLPALRLLVLAPELPILSSGWAGLPGSAAPCLSPPAPLQPPLPGKLPAPRGCGEAPAESHTDACCFRSLWLPGCSRPALGNTGAWG